MRRCNILFASTIFVVKQMLLFVVIFGTFAAIAFFYESVMSTMFNASLGVYGTAFYAVNYERGYVASVALDDIKREFLKYAGKKLRTEEDRREMAVLRRQIRSVQNEGIKVGRFCTLDRLSTLIFIEFTSTKVVSLLIAFI